MSIPIVEQYWGGVARRLQAEVDVFNRLIGHAAEQGRENELVLVRLLENLIPKRFGVGSGIVIDSAGNRSKQTDIIIYDTADQPTVMSQTNQLLFPVEVVHSVIEVKTNLTASDLGDCAEKKSSIAALKVGGGAARPDFLLLAYEAWASVKTVTEHLHAMGKENAPDAVCVVSPGILAGMPASHLGDGSFNVGLVPLHQRDESGARQRATWTILDTPPKGAVFTYEGAAYPVTRSPVKGFIACEPGRAILLFCEALLRSLAKRSSIAQPVLSYYIDDIAKELVHVSPT